MNSCGHLSPEGGPPPWPRRLLMTADPIGGVWSYALELAHGLAKYGVDVELATMGRPLSAQQRREAGEEENVTLHESTFRLEWMDDPWEDVKRSGEWLLSLAAKLRPDLVHLNGYVHAALPWQSPSMVVAHSCLFSWWEAVRREQEPVGLEDYRTRVAKGLAAADLVVAPTAAMLGAIERFYRPLTRSRVIHNACSRIAFSPGPKKEFILSVGRLWDDAKNIAALSRIAGQLPWPVYLAGERRSPDGGAADFDGVSLLGFLEPETLIPWYRTAGIYALPARYEPFGLTVLEAALSGCALVLGDIPSLRELWDGVAVFVDPEDDQALAFELNRLCADSDQLASLGRRALQRSRSYSAAGMASAYLAAYRELAPAPRAGQVEATG